MSHTLLSAALAAVLFATASVRAETHTIRFINQCGYGTPQLIQGGNVVSTGEDYVSNGPFSSAIAYLQTGSCGFNGEGCGMIETNMANPTAPGSGPSSDITLIPPHAFSVWTSFAYWGGTGICDNQGANCEAAGCSEAFYYPDETQVQVACQDDNVNLLIAFCGDATTMDPNGGQSSSPPPPATSSAPPPPATSSVAPPPPTSTYVPPPSSSVAPPPSSSAVPSSSAFSSSAIVASSSSAAPSASASVSAPRCPNKKRSLRHRRDAQPEPEPELEVRSPLEKHRRHHARVAAAGSLH